MADDDKPTIEQQSRRPARWITIKVEGRLTPVVDISDFTAEESQAILQSAADEIGGLVEPPIVTADGVQLVPSYTTLADIAGDDDDDD